MPLNAVKSGILEDQNLQLNVKSVLLYGTEYWKMTKAAINKMQNFINSCPSKILETFWPKICNHDLWGKSKASSYTGRRCIRHTLRKPGNNITRQALTWSPQVRRRKRGRLKKTWWRDLWKDIEQDTWHQIEKIAPGWVWDRQYLNRK